ncbi:repressor of RNA polymerase III transcription MAF1 homolog [Strongylocentrotus purpuratus]|uniref:Repressor of RNA polymerase III transcription MAF1 n=1 Tax=Strongylocentrotus purpuratus TaxID=7668 RepID=A0A7M7N5W9_STRPU|nr:repressor of RNA polymerase III transcription MAF1 homolog [Strongylocentrotus purpuratus]|eukprot:XP_788861.2 PREDICTED: repressor of RNA polymerase III transcription MAF1 homolog [Strongylocentrotus purpuratus]
MKLLENPKLEAISEALAMEMGECRILGKVESYSCKMAGQDKRLFKLLSQENGHSPSELQALSPPQSALTVQHPNIVSRSSGDEAGGPLCHTCSRKMIFYLISTLNAAFHPDYDFSDAKSDEFSREPSLDWTVNAVDGNLFSAGGELYTTQIRPKLWAAINDEINATECEIYSYSPDLSSDPFGEEGVLWSFNYFFYNKKLKRILFFTCRATRRDLCHDSGLGHDLSLNVDDDDLMMESDGESQQDLDYYAEGEPLYCGRGMEVF